MTWRHWLTDARTGLIIRPIDIPSFQWEWTISDSSFTTTPQEKGSKNLGGDDTSSVTVPFSQFDHRDADGNLTIRASQSEIASLLSMGRRGLLTTWAYPACADPKGDPLFWGVIGNPQDHWLDTTFPLSSIPDILAERFAIRDGQYHDGRSTDTVTYSGLSQRGLASELGSMATEQKNGGMLPIDWTYRGEKAAPGYLWYEHTAWADSDDGTKNFTVSYAAGRKYMGTCTDHSTADPSTPSAYEWKSYDAKTVGRANDGPTGRPANTALQAWNVQNLMVRRMHEDIANAGGGPDMTWAPYWADSQHVRMRFLAASDGDQYLETNHPPIVLTAGPRGGSLEKLVVDYAPAIQRWYATGAGADAATVTALAEDMSQITGSHDPPILREAVFSDSDVTDWRELKRRAQGLLAANRLPLMQFTGTIHADDMRSDGLPAHPFGSFRPGEMFYIDIQGHRRLPDGRYTTRLMRMNGDQSGEATCVFDAIPCPV